MAFKKTLAQRLFNINKLSSQTLTNCRISSSSVSVASSERGGGIAPDPGDNGAAGAGVFRRFLHKQSGFQTEVRSHSPQIAGKNLVEQLRAMDISRNRIRLEEMISPREEEEEVEEERSGIEGVTVEDAKKLLKVAQVEMVKSRLRETQKTCMTLSEFIRICAEHCSDQEQAVNVAKMLDDSAAVIILGDVVFLRPDQVAKAIQGLLPVPGAKVHESLRKEFEEMQKEKLAIDTKADTLVRRELWGGLSFLIVQTVGFMRLTFWELTWDVMEPICFSLTSIYFIAGFIFFLRTSKEPSFVGFYQARFSSKQKRLMRVHNFDVGRYNELRAAFSHTVPQKLDSSIALPFDYSSQRQ